jgi:hypothetical protein
VNAALVTRLAMVVAGLMLAHQVAAKAVRDAAFLSAWPAERLPAMVLATAALVVATVPLFSRLLSRGGPRAVIPIGFVASAAAHLVEWLFWSDHPWLAVGIYLHVAGLGALLLSGFWSYVSELFDARTAKASFGRIAAAGTVGGLTGGIAAERMAAMLSQGDTLLFLAGAHAAAAAGLWALGWCAGPRTTARASTEPGRLFQFDVLRAAPHLRTLALLVVLGTAGAGIVDFLLKDRAASQDWSGAELQRFFAVFYTAIQVLTFAAQTRVAKTVRRFGIGRTISSLPAGLGATSALALLFQTFPMFAIARGVESVVRGSLYRSAYELLFVPMDAAEKRRTKTFLDVTCDRAGDALGAVIVQTLLFVVASAFLANALLGVVIALALASIWLGGRLDVMYRRVVERRLVGELPVTPAVIGSEAAWTVVDLPVSELATDQKDETVPPRPSPAQIRRELDNRLRTLAELRSGDRTRVEAALRELRRPEALLVAQAVQLLAWDDVVAGTRAVLEDAAAAHTGLLTDALLSPDTDFAIRRRIPRVLGTVPTQRALNGLLNGLDDTRFEVRYQCARAIERLTSKHPEFPVSRDRIFAVVERELSVPVQIWRGHRLIDRDESDDPPAGGDGAEASVTTRSRRGTEHIYALLATVLPREPLTVAFSGLRSDDRALRGVALEYFDSVLPAGVRAKMGLLLE